MIKTGTLIALLVGIMLAAPAFGAATIDFSTGLAGVGGTFDLSGSNASGTNIPIGALTVSGAPMNNGVYVVTGTCVGSGIGPSGCLNFDTGISSNFVNIIGAIPGLGIASETLLTGTISSFTANGSGIQNAIGPDTKAADLLAVLGLTGTSFNFFGFSSTTSPILTNPGTGSAISTDIRNDAVPEPASIVLLGTAMLFACMALRRRSASRS